MEAGSTPNAAVPQFPTRHYPYRNPARIGAPTAEIPAGFTPVPGTIYRFVLGRDQQPAVLSRAEIAGELNDPFARLFFQRGKLPLSLADILANLQAAGPDAVVVSKQKVFLVADGGQIPFDAGNAKLDRRARLVVLRHNDGPAEMLVSTSAPSNSTEAFLQVFAWDSSKAAFQFYERRGGAWFWAGSSWDALNPPTRGRGPFDSHVNGGPVMKELKAPWMHWDSMSTHMDRSSFAPTDPLLVESFWANHDSAHELENFIRAGVHRWTRSRFDQLIGSDGKLDQAPAFFRQVVETTTINLATSRRGSRSLVPTEKLDLPRTFFFNADALEAVGLDIRLKAEINAAHYLDCLSRYDSKIGDESVQLPGDTHFAFPVPEAAFEDVIVLRELIGRGFITEKLAAAMLLVDFCNPVYSPRRARLAAYLPLTAMKGTGAGSFADQFIAAIEQAASALPSDAPENELLAIWRAAEEDWQAECAARINPYISNVMQKLQTDAGVDAVFRLAESRRRDFRKKPLAEFMLTLPSTNIPPNAPALEMTLTADVRPRVFP